MHQALETMRYAALTLPTQEFGVIKSTILKAVGRRSVAKGSGAVIGSDFGAIDHEKLSF